MHKITTLAIALLLIISALAQETNTWRWGLQTGIFANKSQFTSGQTGAHARFHHHHHGSLGLDFIGRYDFNQQWMVQSGLGFNTIGFEHAIAEFYSFSQSSERFTKLRSSFLIAEIPVMVSYKFNPNCKNWKWFISAGVAAVFVGAHNQNEEVLAETDGPTNQLYFNSQNTTQQGVHGQLRFAIGREKVYQSGRILSFSCIWNVGLSPIAHSTVSYNLDNQIYQHSFTNNGTFFGIRAAYFFKPMVSQTSVQSKNSSLTN